MRVLGGQIHAMGARTAEITKRIASIKGSFHYLGKFLAQDGVAYRLKRMVLLGIQNAGIQNLEAYLVTEGQCKRLDSVFTLIAE
jgi:hypothetical protein